MNANEDGEVSRSDVWGVVNPTNEPTLETSVLLGTSSRMFHDVNVTLADSALVISQLNQSPDANSSSFPTPPKQYCLCQHFTRRRLLDRTTTQATRLAHFDICATMTDDALKIHASIVDIPFEN